MSDDTRSDTPSSDDVVKYQVTADDSLDSDHPPFPHDGGRTSGDDADDGNVEHKRRRVLLILLCAAAVIAVAAAAIGWGVVRAPSHRDDGRASSANDAARRNDTNDDATATAVPSSPVSPSPSPDTVGDDIPSTGTSVSDLRNGIAFIYVRYR